MIYANAVFLHFTEEQLKLALINLKRSLTDNGYIAFRLKSGESETWADNKLGMPRYFKFWNIVEKLQLLFRELHFDIDSLAINDALWIEGVIHIIPTL